MHKTLTQVGLFLILIFVLSLTFYKYFYIKENNIEKVEKTSPDIKETIKTKKNYEEVKNDSEISNLSFKKFDIQNNLYLITARKGKINNQDPNIIIMEDVEASITYLNNEKLIILSKNAIFDKKNFQTKFSNNVKLIYREKILMSDILEFLFDKNIAIFRDNVRYQDLDTKMFSDKITINLLTKDIEISSKNENEKIKIEKNK
tara:strand:+ start:408 stop:1016 length:609 start_codon:yes stop_codon:yes gene_type:complete